MDNVIYLSQKKSGNYVVSKYVDNAWNLISQNTNPKDLFESVKALSPFSKIIKSEYSKSQLVTHSNMYSKKDALKAFGLSSTKSNIEIYFGL